MATWDVKERTEILDIQERWDHQDLQEELDQTDHQERREWTEESRSEDQDQRVREVHKEIQDQLETMEKTDQKVMQDHKEHQEELEDRDQRDWMVHQEVKDRWDDQDKMPSTVPVQIGRREEGQLEVVIIVEEIRIRLEGSKDNKAYISVVLFCHDTDGLADAVDGVADVD